MLTTCTPLNIKHSLATSGKSGVHFAGEDDKETQLALEALSQRAASMADIQLAVKGHADVNSSTGLVETSGARSSTKYLVSDLINQGLVEWKNTGRFGFGPKLLHITQPGQEKLEELKAQQNQSWL